MLNEDSLRHEIVMSNPDIDVRFYLSEDEGSYVTPHWHNSLEIVYVMEGSITVIMGNQRKTIFENQFIIVNSRTIHAVSSTKNRAFVLQIPLQFIRKLVPNIDTLIFHVNMYPSTLIEQTRFEKISKIFQEMYLAYDVRPDAYLLRFYSLLYDLLYVLIHSYSESIAQQQMERHKKYLDRLKKIIDYIHENYKEQITVKNIADLLCYNVDYLSRFFRKYMGMSIIDYIYTIRINHVYHDIISTDLTIKHIFEIHGCTNYHVAMKYFKQRYQCTPKQKRNLMKKTF